MYWQMIVLAQVLVASLLIAQAGAPPAQSREANAGCNQVALTFTLKGGEQYERDMGDLKLLMRPLENRWGWWLELQDERKKDYVYPVSPPLRHGLRQHLGAGYGDTARQALAYERTLRFLLNRAEYDRFFPFLEHALWPYYAPNPDRATEEYLEALGKARKGLLRVKPIHVDFESDDVVRSATFRIELTAPQDFRFAPSLRPKRAACPPPTER